MNRLVAIAVALSALLAIAPGAGASTARYAAKPLPDVRVDGVRTLAPVRGTFAFDLAGVRWRSPAGVTLEVRARAIAGWSRWTPLEPIDRAPEQRDRAARWSEPAWLPGSSELQVRLRGHGLVRGLRVDLVNARSGPAPVRSRAPAVADAPLITSRAAWGADERLVRGTPDIASALKLVFVHHTVSGNGYSRAQAPAIVRSILTYHTRSLGWKDVGYNYLVDAYGQIYEGRAGGIEENVVGAQVEGFNTGTAGIAVIGNGETVGLTPATRSALVALIAWRLDVAHVDPLSRVTLTSGGNPRYAAGARVTLRAVSGHRDGYPTACPGKLIYPELDGIAREVAALGLPKIYAPTGRAGPSGTWVFGARLSAPGTWTARVLDATGNTLASRSGTGQSVAWTWDGRNAAGATVPSASVAGWRIEATDGLGAQARPASGGFGSAKAPSTSLPPGGVEVTPGTISPNGDGDADIATIGFDLAASAVVSVAVADQAGIVVATPSPSVAHDVGRVTATWNGLGLDGLTPVPDGIYRVLITATSLTGEARALVAQVNVARAAALFALPRLASSPNGDGRYDRVSATWRQDVLAPVTVDLELRGKRVRRLFSGLVAPGPARVDWDGRPGAPISSGPYRVVLRAQTAGGTQQVISKPLKVDVTPPAVRQLRINAHATGASGRFALSEPAYIQILAGGRVVVPFGLRKAGLNGFRFSWDVPARNVRIVAQDVVGNRMLPLRVRLG